MLLTRDQFREGVFKRDDYRCVICGDPAKDAHHIIERRLFTGEKEFGGYFLDNGASLCEKHHIEAEKTTLSCDEIREKAKIKNIILPEHYYHDQEYDKWGNPILTNGTRLKGELFFDESVQKILNEGNVLNEFYNNLSTYFYGFSIWNEKNICLSWDETLEYFQLLNITPVDTIYRGLVIENGKITYDFNQLLKINEFNNNPVEGFVLRKTDEFSYFEFKSSIGKIVKNDFEIVHGHWTRNKLIKNELK